MAGILPDRLRDVAKNVTKHQIFHEIKQDHHRHGKYKAKPNKLIRDVSGVSYLFIAKILPGDDRTAGGKSRKYADKQRHHKLDQRHRRDYAFAHVSGHYGASQPHGVF